MRRCTTDEKGFAGATLSLFSSSPLVFFFLFSQFLLFNTNLDLSLSISIQFYFFKLLR